MINKLLSYLRGKVVCAPSLDDDLMSKIEDLQQQLAELRYDSSVEINVQVAQLELVMDEKLQHVEKKLDARIKQLEGNASRKTRTQELLLNHIIGDGGKPNPSAYLKH